MKKNNEWLIFSDIIVVHGNIDILHYESANKFKTKQTTVN